MPALCLFCLAFEPLYLCHDRFVHVDLRLSQFGFISVLFVRIFHFLLQTCSQVWLLFEYVSGHQVELTV